MKGGSSKCVACDTDCSSAKNGKDIAVGRVIDDTGHNARERHDVSDRKVDTAAGNDKCHTGRKNNGDRCLFENVEQIFRSQERIRCE